MRIGRVYGWKIRCKEVVWRCCAMESVTRFNASSLSISDVSIPQESGGRSSGMGSRWLLLAGGESMVIRGDGDGGRAADGEVGCRRGVLALEFMALGFTLRFARRNVKNAVTVAC